MHRICIISAAIAVAATSAAAQMRKPEPPSYLANPAGAYTQSCAPIITTEQRVAAACIATGGARVPMVLEDYKGCRDIQNDGAKLVCVR